MLKMLELKRIIVTKLTRLYICGNLPLFNFESLETGSY